MSTFGQFHLTCVACVFRKSKQLGPRLYGDPQREMVKTSCGLTEQRTNYQRTLQENNRDCSHIIGRKVRSMDITMIKMPQQTD